jgi:hypothetical protein
MAAATGKRTFMSFELHFYMCRSTFAQVRENEGKRAQHENRLFVNRSCHRRSKSTLNVIHVSVSTLQFTFQQMIT